jgi:hypothetical protein
MKEEKEQREEFCGLCLVAPLAFAGAGATAMGGTMSKKHKAWKKTLLVSGIATIVLSIGILVYYFMFKKNCKQCKL